MYFTATYVLLVYDYLLTLPEEVKFSRIAIFFLQASESIQDRICLEKQENFGYDSGSAVEYHLAYNIE